MLQTDIDAWRVSLLLSLGAAACGAELSESQRCDSPVPEASDPRLMRCDNGIVYRPAPEDCTGECAPPVFTFASGFSDRCATSADCSAGLLCIQTFELPSDALLCETTQLWDQFSCQSPKDTCGSHQQCAPSERCLFEAGERHCRPFRDCGGVPGRPFLVDGANRVAASRSRLDWSAGVAEAPFELGAAARLAAAAHWQRAALLEHASIAAFARFTLQLLELGAPFELCQRSQQAMGDEAEHARLCFGLASRYSRAAVGPAGLPLDGALRHESLATVVQLTFREGCVGETCAALEAAEALALATDVPVREALARISADERRHAELAFRFIAWALETDEAPALRQVLELELAAVRMELMDRSPQRGVDSARSETAASVALAHHGVLDVERSRAVRRAAIIGIVVPCAERLIATAARMRPPPATAIAARCSDNV